MVARGHVRNGVIVLDHGIQLTEGLEVTVIGSVDHFASTQRQIHSVLEIPTVSLGPILNSTNPDDDVLGEMLDSRS